MAATLTPGPGRGWREPPAEGMSQLRSARCLPVFINLLIFFWNSCPEPGRTSPPTLRGPLPKAGGCGEGTIATPGPTPGPPGDSPRGRCALRKETSGPVSSEERAPHNPSRHPKDPRGPPALPGPPPRRRRPRCSRSLLGLPRPLPGASPGSAAAAAARRRAGTGRSGPGLVASPSPRSCLPSGQGPPTGSGESPRECSGVIGKLSVLLTPCWKQEAALC